MVTEPSPSSSAWLHYTHSISSDYVALVACINRSKTKAVIPK